MIAEEYWCLLCKQKIVRVEKYISFLLYDTMCPTHKRGRVHQNIPELKKEILLHYSLTNQLPSMCKILTKIYTCRQVLVEPSKSNLVEICPRVLELLHENRQAKEFGVFL